MRTQAIEVRQGRRGEVIVRQPQRRKVSWTAAVFIGFGRLIRWFTRGMARHGWSKRWHLTPLAGGAWVLAYGAAAPLATSSALALAGTLSSVWAWRGKRKAGSRMFLSVIERAALAEGLFGAGLWVAGEWTAAAAGYRFPAAVDLGLYALLTGHAAGVWWWSRRPTWVRWGRKDTGEFTSQWAEVEAKGQGWAGSHIDYDTVEHTEDDDVSFDVVVAGHADDITEESRKVVESTIKVDGGADLPHRAVQIAHIDRSVRRVRVTISPRRAMEGGPVVSDGIQPLARDGSLVLAKDTARRPVKIHRFGPTGVRHMMISGGTDGGKSNTLSRAILPGLLTVNDRGRPIVTCWSLDGGLGTSTPYLAPAFDINATQPWQFPILIDAVYAVHLSRERRRGLAGRYDWRTWEEEDPILDLLIQEARGVAPYLSPDQHRKYATMAMRARKIGLGLIQEGQDFARGNAVGGEDMPEVRKQLAAGGVVLAHRDGDNDKRTLQGSHDATQLVRGVNSLPAGGGWLIPIEQGTVLAKRARTVWDDIDVRAAAARSVTPRPLEGEDLAAAMSVEGFAELYEHRHDPTWSPPAPEVEPAEPLVTGPRPFQPVAQPKPLAADRVRLAITEHMASTGDPLGKTDAERLYGIPGATWELGRAELLAADKIHQPKPGKWAPGPNGARS